MPVQRWTCEKCGRLYDTIQDASRCEQTHRSGSMTRSLPVSSQPAIPESYTNTKIHIELDLEQDDPQWGAHINVCTFDKSEQCPDWVNHTLIDKWRERGIVVWDKAGKQVARLSAANALQVLNHLQTNGTESGIVVGEPSTIIPLNRSDHKPRQILSSKINLDTAQSNKLLKFLQENAVLLQQMAEEDEKQEARLLGSVYKFLLESAARRKAEARLQSKPSDSSEVLWCK